VMIACLVIFLKLFSYGCLILHNLANCFLLLFQNPAEYQESANTVSLAARSCHIENFTSSSKQETPKLKIDMEAKLRAWLESKGKTKSIQRMDGLFSPIASKTPLSVSHMKQPTSSRIPCRVKAMDQDGGKIKKLVFFIILFIYYMEPYIVLISLSSPAQDTF
jgi:hypothetical protein